MDIETLRQIGVDIDELKEEVTARVVSKIYDEICDKVSREAVRRVDAKIDAEVTRVVAETLAVEYQPLTRWGEADGKPTTLRDAFYKAGMEWWNTKVDGQGKPDSSWNCKERYIFVAQQVMGEVLNNYMKADLEKVVSDAKNKLKDAIAATIAKAVEKI